MIRIHKPARPTKRSGYPLEPNRSTKINGITITNTTSVVVYVDRQTPKKKKAKKKK
jgi:hypothetical protein